MTGRAILMAPPGQAPHPHDNKRVTALERSKTTGGWRGGYVWKGDFGFHDVVVFLKMIVGGAARPTKIGCHDRGTPMCARFAFLVRAFCFSWKKKRVKVT